jgi:hypothetical protein
MSAPITILCPMKKGDPTEFTYQWAQEGIKIARSLGYDLTILEKDDVTYHNVTESIKKYKPKLLASFSHGCPASLQGQRECSITRKFSVDDLVCMLQYNPKGREQVLRLLNPLGQLSCPGICALDNDPCGGLCTYDTNINLMRDSMIFAVACHSAAQLGECGIKYGLKSYVGEDDLLMFPVDSLHSQDIFGEVQLTFFKELLMGKTVQEAENAMSELEDSYIRRFIQTKYIALPLLWNKIHRKVLGNKYAMIYE